MPVIFNQNGKAFIKEEIPTARFWLMCKLAYGWDRRWDIYVKNLDKNLDEMMKTVGEGEKGLKVKKIYKNKIKEKIIRSAWATMPASFLERLNMKRVIHL